MFAASALALLLAAPPGDTYPIQWKLKEGDIFYNKAVVVTEQKIETQGSTVEQKMEATTVLRFRVKSVALPRHGHRNDVRGHQDRNQRNTDRERCG